MTNPIYNDQKNVYIPSLPRQGMTLRGLLQATPRDIRDRSAHVTVYGVTHLHKMRHGDPPCCMLATQTKDPDNRTGEIQPHRVFVELVSAPKDASPLFDDQNSLLRVDCNCEDYSYRHCHAMAKHGAAIYYRVNGPAPITNPSNLPGVCKHIVAALQYLASKRIKAAPLKTKR